MFGSIVDVRNYIAYPEGHMVTTPSSVIRHLRDVAEIIAKLWGHDTPGGRLFPGPSQRWPRLAAISPDRTASMQYGDLPDAPPADESDWTYLLCLAARAEDLVMFDHRDPGHIRFARLVGFDVTRFPVTVLAGPGPWASIADAVLVQSTDAPADEVPFLDRIFYVRIADHGVELPRSAEDVLVVALDDDDARWYAICADEPMDAFGYVRDLVPESMSKVDAVRVVKKITGDNAAKRHANSHRSRRER